MSGGHAALTQDWHIHVADLDLLEVFGQENVCGFDVTVEDVFLVQGFKCVDHLDGQPPDLLFWNQLLSFSVWVDEAAQVAALCELRNHAQRPSHLLIKRLFVPNDVRIVDAGQDSNLIEGIGDFSLIGVGDFDFFEGVDFGVLFSFDFVDAGEGALADFGNDFELIHGI